MFCDRLERCGRQSVGLAYCGEESVQSPGDMQRVIQTVC